MKSIYLYDCVIYSPRTDCIYHLINQAANTSETIVTFKGSKTHELEYFDVSVGIYRFHDGPIIRPSTKELSLSMLANESLPWATKEKPKLPTFIYQENEIRRIKEFHIHFEEGSTPFLTFLYERPTFSPLLTTQFLLDNPRLKADCEQQVKDINVIVSDYPIILSQNNPSGEFFSHLYQQFITYNTDTKLQYQYDHSFQFCHMRAHVISELLSKYGIESIKVFKKWPEILIEENWFWHCAVMLIDSENNQWVWDPWVKMNHKLLTLPQWISYEGKAKPDELIITNRLAYTHLSSGTAYGSRISQLNAADHKAFQAVLLDAVPNPPTFSLSLRRKKDPCHKTVASTFQDPNRFFQAPNHDLTQCALVVSKPNVTEEDNSRSSVITSATSRKLSF